LRPIPISPWLFLGCLAFAVGLILSARGGGTRLWSFAPIVSPTLLVFSLATIAEVVLRRLKTHAITAFLTLPPALAYWLMTCGLVVWGGA
jgi:hypothetical protein